MIQEAGAQAPEYFQIPKASQPLNDLMPDGGVEPRRGMLQINSSVLHRSHNVNLDTRQVEIVEYLVIGADSGKDSTALWQAYYPELNVYSTDMYDLLLRSRWMLEFMGKEEAAPGGTPGTFVFDLPFRIPDWARHLGIDKPALTINGSYKLVMEGSRKSGSGVQYTSGWFPNLHMDQQPAFVVKGTIGRFISVEINSEEGLNATNLKQQLKISYKGEGDELEDDVVQEIEAGNTSLALPGSDLTGYTQNHTGLFDLKMRLRFGNLEMTGIASQEGGTQARQKLGVGNEASQFTVEDKAIDFFKHFWLQLSDRTEYGKTSNWSTSPYKYVQDGRNRRPVQVFQLLNSGEEPTIVTADTACAYDLAGGRTDLCDAGRWKPLKEGTDFIYDENLRMVTVPAGNRYVTLAARWQNDFITTNRGRGKILIYSQNHQDTPLLDSLMWRNVYAISRVSAQDRAAFTLSMIDNNGNDRAPNDTPYVRKLGLTKYNEPTKLDVDNTLIFNFDQGYMVLPCLSNVLKGGDSANCLEPMKRVRSDVKFYSESIDEVQNGSSASKFVIVGKQHQSTFDVHQNSLSASGQQCVDIEPGTEQLLLNGSTLLQKGLDYDVIYESGQITLTSARARDPNAQLDISYECNPPFQIQDKVLLGTRFEYKLDGISDQSLLGATILYKSQTTTEKQPELGHEPFNQLLVGLNARLAGEPKWMTRFANLFPLVHTEAASKVNFEFEMARSFYNPNTKNNAYVDNFDFSQSVTSMPMTIYSWTKASPPNLDDNGILDGNLDYRHQGQLIWHSSMTQQYYQIYGSTGNSYTNSREQTLLKLSLQPNDNLEGHSWGGVMRSLSQGLTNQSRKRVLEVVVQGRGGTLYADLGRVSEDISISGLNNGKPDGRLESEVNVNSGDYVNRLDAGLDGFSDGLGEAGVRWECKPNCYAIPLSADSRDPGQDDWKQPSAGATDEPATVDGTEGNNKGSQGNAFDSEDLDRSGTLDTLNRYLRFPMPLDSECTSRYYCEELKNGWRKYQIPLYGGGKIIDPSNTETERSLLSNAKLMRIWLGHLPPRVAKTDVLVARVNLVGNAWEEGSRNTNYEIDANRFGSGDLGDTNFIRVPPSPRDSNLLHVDVVNKQESPAYQQSPGTPREIDSRTNEPLPERALVLRYENLHPGEAVQATRILSNEPKDFTQYARMSLAIHSDSNWALNSINYHPGQNRVSFGLQLGRDRGDGNSKDYYEIRVHMDTASQIDPEQRSLWTRNSFEVNLSDLTDLKNDPIYRAFGGRYITRPAYHTGRRDSSLSLAITGDPNLGHIDWMRLVVYVDSAATQTQKGEIWVNDLNLEGVDRASGTALRSQIQLDFADFINVSGNLTYTNGNFTTLTQTKTTPSNASSRVDYNTNLALYANKFMPDEWAVSIPVTLQYNGSLERPFTRDHSDLRLSGTDIIDMAHDLFDGRLSSIHNAADSLSDIDNRYARVYQKTTFTHGFGLSYHKDMRSQNFLIRTFLERPDWEYHFSRTDHSEYFQESNSRSFQFKLRYNLSPSTPLSFKPLGFSEKWKYMPGGVSGLETSLLPEKLNLVLADYSFVRSHVVNKPRTESEIITPTPPQYDVNLGHGLDLEWKPITFFNFGYRVDVTRDFDRDRECMDGDHFFTSENTCGIFANRLIFAWDRSDPVKGRYVQTSGLNSVIVDTTHYGNEYGILARERNRNQSFHSDVNLNPLSWLTLGAGFNSGYQHTWNARQDNSTGIGTVNPSYFQASADHDVRLTTGVNLPNLFSFFKPVKEMLDKYRVRSADFTYNVSNKYNDEAFTYSYLKNKGVNYGTLLMYQLGFVYNFSNLGTLFDGEPNTKFFDYLSQPDPTLTVNAMNHVVNRSVDVQSGFSIPVLNLDLTGSLKYSKQYSLYRGFTRPSDTVIVWPDYTISGTFNDFASKVPGLRHKLRSLTAYSNYNFRRETTFDLFSPSPDVDKISHIWKPFLRLSATTNSDVRAEISFNGSFEHILQHGKDAGLTLGRPLSYLGDRQPLVPEYLRDTSKESPRRTTTLGVAPTVSWDLQTQKGIQFWKYYIKLQNSLRLILNSSLDYTLAVSEENGISHRDQDWLRGMVKPEADYNFTNNVDAKFWAQYNFDQFFNTPKKEYTHTIEIHGEFTMRF